MKLSFQQLAGHLQKTLLPVYLITGNEPFLLQEAKNSIRQKALSLGFTERQLLESSKDFDWNVLLESTNTLSLFSDKCCLELKLIQKPAATNSKILIQAIEKIPATKILLITSDKLDSATQKTTWFQAINAAGAIISIWPFDTKQFQWWVEQRLSQHRLQLDSTSVQYLMQQTEGNLLAAAQEIEKLALCFSNGPVSYEDVKKQLSDNAKFDIFVLVDTVLQRNSKRALRILSGLRNEGIEPTLILWVLTREIRTLIYILDDIKRKIPWTTITKQHQIWEKRQPLIQGAIKFHTTKKLHSFLLQAAKIDQIIKGAQKGNSWDELNELALCLSGYNNLK